MTDDEGSQDVLQSDVTSDNVIAAKKPFNPGIAAKVSSWNPKKKSAKSAESSMFQTATNALNELKDVALQASNSNTQTDKVDALDVFGKCVASELRGIVSPEVRQSVKRKIMMALLDGQETDLTMKNRKPVATPIPAPIPHAETHSATYFPLTVGNPNINLRSSGERSSFRNVTPSYPLLPSDQSMPTGSATADIIGQAMFETFGNN